MYNVYCVYNNESNVYDDVMNIEIWRFIKTTKSKYRENNFFSSSKKFCSLDIKGCITGKNNLLAEAAFKILYQSMERNTGFYWLNFFHTIFNSSKGRKALTSWLIMSFLTIVTLFLLPLFLLSPLNA